MEATAYCACWRCTGKRPGDKGYGLTASGDSVMEGMVAVDKSVIPLGTRMWIERIGEVFAADTGSAIRGNRIDIFMESHFLALEFGRKMVRVTILGGE